MNFDADYESETLPYQILAVDDEPHVINAYRRSLGDALGGSGSGELSKLEADLFGYIKSGQVAPEFSLKGCTTGEAAVEQVKKALSSGRPFSAVLMDKHMPGRLDGVEAARQIRVIDPSVVIVVVTGEQGDGTLKQFRGLANDDRFFIFYKPFYPAELKQFLLAVCSNSRLEQRLFSIKRDLEKRVHQRTALLAAARDEAQAALEAKSVFLANVSHEVRTPLNGILGMACLLGAEDLTEAQAEQVAIIHKSGSWMLEIINGLLEMASIESGSARSAIVTFRPEDVIDDTVAMARGLLIDRNVTIATQISEAASGKFVGDPHRIKQILMNLVGNAIKFSEAGSVEIAATLEDSGALRISVSDDGPGIPPEALHQIFERFQRSVGTDAPGTGLGLAISKELVEMMGGQIGVNGRARGGSEFYFTVPPDQATT